MADKTWPAGPGQFDTDPLSADWQTAPGSTGPIRLDREEDWSYGLADLFRSGSGVLIGELFDIAHERTPDSVETEAHLPGSSETTRYEDILINYAGGGTTSTFAHCVSHGCRNISFELGESSVVDTFSSLNSCST